MPNLLYYDDRFLQHATGRHPECALRLSTCTTHIRQVGVWQLWEHPTWQPATVEHLNLVHEPALSTRIQQMAQQGGGQIDADTVVSPASYDVALLAVGAAVDATRKVVQGDAGRAFCLVRPPGHHATHDTSMGFCLFNNIAVAAKLAIEKLGLNRVLIVDWDVHHGNGTQDIFWRDGRVGFFSMQRYPFWPGSGDKDARGEGPGLGFTRNLPVRHGTDRETILTTFEQQLHAFADQVRPELVLISAGFDAHREDPIGDLGLTTDDFGRLTEIVVQVADTWSQGRIVSLLEGGYHPQRLAESVELHLRALAIET